MKFFKYIALSLFLAISTAGVSSVAFASVFSDIDNVSTKIAEAQQALNSGASNEDVISLIREANNLTKIIMLPDSLVSKRQRGNAHLKKARLAVKKDNRTAAEAHLEKAAKSFADLKGYI